jgi:glycogen operon protein
VVIGEDLGTVPEGFREEITRRGILRSLVLYFERQGDGAFTAPAHYARAALASANTHDLPTLRGFVESADIEERCARGGIDDGQRQVLREERARDREALLALLRSQGLLDGPDAPDATRLCRAVYELLARASSALVAVALEDLGDELHAANLPGAPDPERINWTRRMHRTLEAMIGDDDLAAWLRARAAR